MPNIHTNPYDKWDCAESADVAFEKVRTNEWDKKRFLEWHSHYEATLIRDTSADEDM